MLQFKILLVALCLSVCSSSALTVPQTHSTDVISLSKRAPAPPGQLPYRHVGNTIEVLYDGFWVRPDQIPQYDLWRVPRKLRFFENRHFIQAIFALVVFARMIADAAERRQFSVQRQLSILLDTVGLAVGAFFVGAFFVGAYSAGILSRRGRGHLYLPSVSIVYTHQHEFQPQGPVGMGHAPFGIPVGPFDQAPHGHDARRNNHGIGGLRPIRHCGGMCHLHREAAGQTDTVRDFPEGSQAALDEVANAVMFAIFTSLGQSDNTNPPTDDNHEPQESHEINRAFVDPVARDIALGLQPVESQEPRVDIEPSILGRGTDAGMVGPQIEASASTSGSMPFSHENVGNGLQISRGREDGGALLALPDKKK